ncbi:alpha-2-macroglobulin family protein [Spirosoma utsteinense]|uniref:Alpha-2-macroglobulin family protein n=1 Tax=Spirosoma utsteinense TaxID=2585773 RepID=A0ABR6W9C4_9BACT|nr:MG2 domain-containing protein [Spirosoma utsteinense]MBC3784870.1 hypothetical protein [Spirosoma utsteinense]MBC3792430.1 hypothetical protein [Spirosoma utsteinense]
MNALYTHRLAYTLLCLVFVGLGCSRLSFNEVAVVGRNFEDEVQQTQNLTFTFNKNVGAERAINEWDSTQYLRFKPAVRGKFKWTAPNELVFSPAVAFDPATDYRAELTSDLLRQTDAKEMRLSASPITFHTPYLQLAGTESWWSRSAESGQPVAKVRLNFNYAVNSAEVSGKLSATSNDQALTTQVVGSSVQHTMALVLNNLPAGSSQARNEQPLTLHIDKGLKVSGTAYVSQEAIEQKTAIPSRYTIDIADVQTSFDGNRAGGPQGVVRVITTQELQPGALDQYYTIQPQVATTAELTENGFVIRGNFTEADTYVLTLTDQIRGVLGTKLTEPVTRDLFFGKMPASISFVNSKALYLTSKGARNIGLNIVNVPNVQVKIAKLYENNLLTYLRSNRYEQYAEAADGQWKPTGGFTYSADEQADLSDVLVNKTVAVGDLPTVRGVSALNVALPDEKQVQGQPLRGIYLVSVASKEEAYLQASQLVSVSDIGLVARQTNDEILVWANSIHTTEPMQGVEVTLISSNNQSVYSLKTDGSGFVRFDKVSEKAPGFKISLLTARSGDAVSPNDFNFLFLPDTQIETSRFEVDGKRDNESGFNAFVYGDRDIYRPGETIHFNTVIRSQSWQSVAEVPVLIRILTPNGRELRAFRKTTNAQGAISTDVPLDPAVVTGNYTIEVLNANTVLLTSQSVSVEEFVPDRIKVDVLTDRSQYKAGQTVTLSATALNLFGPPAADRAYEMELQLKPRIFAPKGYEEYNFKMASDQAAGTGGQNAFPKELRQGRTNANGQATERFLLPAIYQDMGLLDGKLFVTVFDENGRPVNRLRRFDVLTQETLYGVRIPDRYVTTGTPLAAEVVALDPAGALRLSASAQIEIVRYDYQTVIEKKGEGNQSQVNYTTRRREKSVYSNTLPFKGGKAAIRYVPTVSGEYEIRVRRLGQPGVSTGYSATRFYAYGYGSTSASSFDVSQEGQVLMTLDKPTYQTGDRATLLFKAPFDGKLLVTVERNQVLEHHWLTTANKAAEWSFALTADHLPNVYITATLIRAIGSSAGADANLPITVAHGYISVPVGNPATQLPISIAASPQSRSKTKQTIRIKTARNAQVTVAVVDEGILQLKNFRTPDPHGFFYQKRALEVGSHDLYALLYPELSLRSARSSTGGDGYDLERRVNPLSNGRVRLVALWSGILETGSDGEAAFSIDVPQFSGDLRVMAVAYKDNAFGSATSNIKVADPIVISTGVPRFLTPGDQVELPVNLSNTTSKAAVVTARLSLTGPLTADSAGTRKLTIQPGREVRTTFRISASQSIGPGMVLVTVNGLNETFTEKTDVTVRPAASLQKITIAGMVAGGQGQPLKLAGQFLPGTARASMTLSRSPIAQYGRELSYLLGYPHGCIEQTISKAFPQLYFADLTKQFGSHTYFVRSGESDFNPTTTVREAVQKVESLQLQTGGFAMWPGATGASTGQNRFSGAGVDMWASAYALHFLSEAQEAGYEVRPSVLSSAIDFLTTFTNNPSTESTVTFDESGRQTVRKVASRTAIYGLYTLSVAGRPNRPAMNYYKEAALQKTGPTLTLDSRYLLAAAFYRLGDSRSFAALLPRQFVDQPMERQTGGSYASPLRNLALVLDVLADTDPNNLQIPTLARQLSTALRQSTYLNTQEAAFAFLALGKIARQNAGNTATATLLAGNKPLGNLTGAFVNLNRLPTNVPLLLNAKGSGNIYYFAQSEGVPMQGKIPETDAGLQIRRQYLNRDGKPIAGTVRQNDLVIVKVTLTSQTGLNIENVVITDLLPAGLEVENPRLSEQRDMPWIKATTTPDHFDLRDDRINFYTNADSNPRTFYYLARATTKGRFIIGPISADAMYNGEYRSYSGAGTLLIN